MVWLDTIMPSGAAALLPARGDAARYAAGKQMPGIRALEGGWRRSNARTRNRKNPRPRQDRSRRFWRKMARGGYLSTESLKAFAARRRTTVLALILMGSPVWGLRPMRALRWAFTARPRFGITNLPAAPLHSFTASLKSSSKNSAAVFLGVPHFSARCATIFDLLIGFAIEFLSPLLFSFSKVLRACGRSQTVSGRARA